MVLPAPTSTLFPYTTLFRSRRVDRVEPPGRRGIADGRRDAVRREDERRVARHLVHRLDEDRPAPLEIVDDVLVVDDLLANVDRRAVEAQRPLDRVDSPLDPGAEAAWGSEEDAP